MTNEKELQLLNLENIMRIPRHAWIYRPSTNRYYIYSLSKRPFPIIQRVIHEDNARKLTLELNHDISVDAYLEAKQEYEQLLEEKHHGTVRI